MFSTGSWWLSVVLSDEGFEYFLCPTYLEKMSIDSRFPLVQDPPAIPQPFRAFFQVPAWQVSRSHLQQAILQYINILQYNVHSMYIEESYKLQSFVFWLETATLRDLLNLCPLDAAGRLRGCECLLGSQWRFPHNCVRKGEAQGISISQSDACHRANMTNPTTSSVVEDVLTTCCLLPFKREITVFKQIKKVLGFVKWEAILEGCSMCCLMFPP